MTNISFQNVLDSIIRASAYIESKQNDDGSWSFEDSKEGCCYYSAQVTYSLAQVRNQNDPNLIKARDYLINNVNTDNGWGRYETKISSDIFATSYCLLAISRIGRPMEPVSKAIAWITSHQSPDGGFGYAGTDKSTVKGTTHALFALGMFNDSPAATIDRCLEYLQQNQREDGGWGNHIGEPSRASCTASVTEAISENKLQNRFKGNWEKAIKWLPDNKKGNSWTDIILHYDTEATTCAINSLLNVGYKTTHNIIQESLEYLITIQRSNGAFSLGQSKTNEDIGATADVIRTLSTWILNYISENPYVIVQQMESLAEMKYRIIKKGKKPELIKIGEDNTRSYEVMIPKFFRVSWGKTEHFVTEGKK